MMRWRRCIHLLLAGLLVLAQAGGAAHAVTHFADGGERQDHGTAGDACDLCAAYSALGQALGVSPGAAPVAAVDGHAAAGDTPAPAFFAQPAQRARGPPSHA